MVMNPKQIREHMPVIAGDGQRIGNVDRVEGSSIKLTRSAPAAHGEHRYFPLAWVESVSDHVRLDRTSDEVVHGWQETPVGAGF
jgi:hypothetical protein